ncbi:hypothetical protein WT97_05560 [Burkholderia sp. MSMB1459WGS]|nr:hypothetical protein WT97_05560 [Burkholderia sp. MSMB1459WGS]
MIAWIESSTVRATCVDTQMYMGMCFVIVFSEDIKAAITKDLMSKGPGRISYCLAIGTRWHRQQHVKGLSAFAILGNSPATQVPLFK